MGEGGFVTRRLPYPRESPTISGSPGKPGNDDDFESGFESGFESEFNNVTSSDLLFTVTPFQRADCGNENPPSGRPSIEVL